MGRTAHDDRCGKVAYLLGIVAELDSNLMRKKENEPPALPPKKMLVETEAERLLSLLSLNSSFGARWGVLQFQVPTLG